MDKRPSARPLRVVFWGTYDTGKPRVRILLDGLRLNEVEVIECHYDLWSGIEDKSQVKGVGRWIRLLTRMAVAYPSLIWRYLRLPHHDVVMVLYPGLIDLFIIRSFTWLRRKPLVWDWFLSAYDTIVLDRRLLNRRNPLAWIIRAIEWAASRLVDAAFMDTAAHARRMEHLFGLSAGTLRHAWVGVEREHFAPHIGGCRHRTCAGEVQVLFYGQFIPLHGITTIVAAAGLLRDQPVCWQLIGRGQEAPRIRRLLELDPLPKLHWREWIDYTELGQAMSKADVVLGIFGTSDKAASVIPNKVFQIIAARRALITRDSPAIRELLADMPLAVQLVPPGDAHALAAAVRGFVDAAAAGADIEGPHITDEFDAAAIGKQLSDILLPLLKKGTDSR